MTGRFFLTLSCIVILAMPGAARAADEGGAPWGYTGVMNAQNWGNLDADYHACALGAAQSPVNIARYREEDAPKLEFSYRPGALDVSNTGHTVRVNAPPGSTLSIGGKVFVLKEFHFHTPGEHYLDGAPYPMEAHFVHEDGGGALAVVAVLMKAGAPSAAIRTIWDSAPGVEGTHRAGSVTVNAADLLPPAGSRAYYHYAGSLTTPPCTEGVEWYVLREPVEISEDQIKAFQNIFPVNARPVQPLNDRIVTGG